jgi:hypothetical protein
MKRTSALNVALIVALMGTPALYAQHGHGGGMSGMGHGNSGMSSHSSSRPDSPTTGKTNSSVSTRLASNTKLASKLQSLLPAGTDLQQASQGFKNLGQFVAAVHVSKNLGIPFDQLKAKMVGPPAESLGKAIHDLKPATDAKAEAKKAGKQADQDINDTDKDS